MPLNAIRLVSFDALHTIITPRLPVHVQYSQVFAPYLGKLDPDALKSSFKVALKAVQVERPAYIQGAQEWWHEVIRRTGLGAGANEQTLESSLSRIVPALMARFSSREGYKAFDDALPTIQRLQDEFNIRAAVVSNGDSRIRLVLNDLGFPASLNPIIVSEEEGCEKPSRELFMRTLERVNTDIRPPIKPEEWLHVGDELVCDYRGAVEAGLHALLLRRRGAEGEQAHTELNECLDGVDMIQNLGTIIEWLKQRSESP